MLEWLVIFISIVLLYILVSSQRKDFRVPRSKKTHVIEGYILPEKYRRALPKNTHFVLSHPKDVVRPKSKAINVLFHTEPGDVEGDWDIILGRQFTIPSTVWGIEFSAVQNFSLEDLLKSRLPGRREKFCAFMYHNCDESFSGVEMRHRFVGILERISGRKVDILGKCLGSGQQNDRQVSNWRDVAIDKYKEYMFVIAFENTAYLHDYITEKMTLPLLAGAIPIYLGALNVKDHFNPKSFIDVCDFETLEHCAQYVSELYENSLACQRIQEQPPIIDKETLIKYNQWYYWMPTFYEPFCSALKIKTIVPYQSLTGWRSKGADFIVINLDRHKDRWNNIQLLFNMYGSQVTFERFPAINGAIYEPQIRAKIDWKWRNGYHLGEIGVFLSNMEIYYSLTQEGPDIDFYAILEDDVSADGEIESPRDIVKRAPPDWDVIFLGLNKNACKLRRKYEFTKLDCMPGAFSYIIRKRMAQYFINFFDPIEAPIDEVLTYLRRDFNMYAVSPQIFVADYSIKSSTASNDL